MKILYVATVDIHIINHHLRVIKKLHDRGDIVDVASNGNYTNENIRKKFNVCFSKKPLHFNNIKAYFRIKEIIEEGDYDIVSCHTPISSFLTRIAARNMDLKVIYTAHGFHFFRNCPLKNSLIYKTMERIAARYTDILVTINQEDFDAANQFQLKNHGEVKLVDGVGIDLTDLNRIYHDDKITKESIGFKQGDYLIFSVGEVNKNKNHMLVLDSLLEVMTQNPHIHYIICGCGPLMTKIEKWILKNRLSDQVHLMGYRENVKQLLKVADLFVLPSRREGLPVAVLEAMALEKPIIVSNVRGCRDLIKHERNGLVFSDNQSVNFFKCFQRLYENHLLSKKLAKQAFEDVQMYSSTIVDEQILNLYHL